VNPPSDLSRRQIRTASGLTFIVLLGSFIFILGIHPGFFGLDRSPVVGFVQMGVWLTGLAVVLLGAYGAARIVRNGRKHSLRSEIGVRLVATGYVVALAASLADFLGIGSHPLPRVYFGPIQVAGLMTGVVLSLTGLILYLPRRRRKPAIPETKPDP
jgi:hypothetical protein